MTTNKLALALASGALASKGVTFNRNALAYFAVFESGAVGVYSKIATSSFTYTEYSIQDRGVIRHSVVAPKGFKLTGTIESFFDSLFSNNARIAGVTDEALAEATGLHEHFVTEVLSYTPKVGLVTLNMTDFAITQSEKDALAISTSYLNKVGAVLSVDADLKCLGEKLQKFVAWMIKTALESEATPWRSNTPLTLNVENALYAETEIFELFETVLSKCNAIPNKVAPTWDSLLSAALEPTRYDQLRYVDLTISPYFCIAPKRPGVKPYILPPVPQTETVTQVETT